MKKHRYHLATTWQDGAAEFVECPQDSEDSELQVIFATPVKSGEAVPLGCRLVRMTPDQDGCHFNRENLDGIGKRGPLVVNAKAFRDGWEHTFGKNGVN